MLSAVIGGFGVKEKTFVHPRNIITFLRIRSNSSCFYSSDKKVVEIFSIWFAIRSCEILSKNRLRVIR